MLRSLISIRICCYPFITFVLRTILLTVTHVNKNLSKGVDKLCHYMCCISNKIMYNEPMTYLMRTGRKSITVRPHLRERLNGEDNVNKLINNLLEIYYKQSEGALKKWLWKLNLFQLYQHINVNVLMKTAYNGRFRSVHLKSNVVWKMAALYLIKQPSGNALTVI